MILKEFYNIFQNNKFNVFNNIFSKLYLFLRGMFLFVFGMINFGVPQIFHIIECSLTSKRLRTTVLDSRLFESESILV